MESGPQVLSVDDTGPVAVVAAARHAQTMPGRLW